jgi:GTP-binding protein HflX
VLARLHRAEPDAIDISALTGSGLDELRQRIAQRLPRPDVSVTVLVPYDRGDLVARVHQRGRVEHVEHEDTGTRLTAAVPAYLVNELKDYLVVSTSG